MENELKSTAPTYEQQRNENHEQSIKESKARICSWADNKIRTDGLLLESEKSAQYREKHLELEGRLVDAWESLAESLKKIADE